uniref:DUF4332 domain-containing protein n=1 Tax=uncultured bacterium A1Q1_fos_504 TaxID=1256580 RepID=L7VRT7_9BACT|nr:conserved hypothetical protein [uncultured bacterium A1Q1_fos_504]
MAKVIDIEGIGPVIAGKLQAAGINTTDELLERGATPAGREAIAAQTGWSTKQVLEWVNRADLMRVRGVGSEFSDLLEQAGVEQRVAHPTWLATVETSDAFHLAVGEER